MTLPKPSSPRDPTSDPGQDRSPAQIQSLSRGIRLLEEIVHSDRPITGVEAADRAEINRSTAWRLLSTLEQHRLLERDESGHFRAGIALVGLATESRRTAVARRARPILASLSDQTGETAAVAVIEGAGFEIVDQVDEARALSVRWVGTRLPLNCTSVGKLVLASLGATELDAFLSQPVERRTPRTLTDPDAIRAELDDVRRTGVAASIGDYELGVNGIAAAARDGRGRPVAVLAVTGPSVRLTEERLPQVSPIVLDAAAQLEQALQLTSRGQRQQKG